MSIWAVCSRSATSRPQPLGVAGDDRELAHGVGGQVVRARSSRSAYPRIEVSGVRSSWDTEATNSSLTRSARMKSVTSL